MIIDDFNIDSVESLKNYVEYLNEQIKLMGEYANYINSNITNHNLNIPPVKTNYEPIYYKDIMDSVKIQVPNKKIGYSHFDLVLNYGAPFLKFDELGTLFYEVYTYGLNIDLFFHKGVDYFTRYKHLDSIGYVTMANPKTMQNDLFFKGRYNTADPVGSEILCLAVSSPEITHNVNSRVRKSIVPLLYLYDGFDVHNQKCVDNFIDNFPESASAPIYLYPIFQQHYSNYMNNFEMYQWKIEHNKYHDWIIDNDILNKIGNIQDYCYIGLDWVYLLDKGYKPAYDWVKYYLNDDIPLKEYLKKYNFQNINQNLNSKYNSGNIRHVTGELLNYIWSNINNGTLSGCLERNLVGILKEIWEE